MPSPVKKHRALFATAVAAATLAPFSASAVTAPPAQALQSCSPGYSCTWEFYNTAQHLPPVVGWTTYNCDTTVSSWGQRSGFYIFTKVQCPGSS